MDPWLEQHWGDIHHSIITYARDQLQPRLPGGLRARMGERLLVEDPEEETRSIYPDLRVVEHFESSSSPDHGQTAVACAEPLLIQYPNEPEKQGYIEIIDPRAGKVITAIEVLSRANKFPGPGQQLYLQKQQELERARVSLVEIDLLRAGDHVIGVPLSLIPASHRTPYCASVRRSQSRYLSEFYAIPLSRPLPAIRVPLRKTDADVVLELQPLIEQAYINGGYDDLDYTKNPEPPLRADDAAWANELLRSKGKR
jgi:hypothetical protein